MMNKKSLVIISFAFIFLLSVSIIFAQENVQDEKISFGKWLKNLWGKITGTTITGMPTLTCTDSDNGKTYTTRGTCTDSNGVYSDICGNGQIREYFCNFNYCYSQKVDCPAGYSCVDGACIGPTIDPIDSIGGVSIGGVTTCPDIDGDGFFVSTRECATPYDCNDNNEFIKPGNANTFCDCETIINPAQGTTETCGNNIDEDCSGADLVCPTPCSNEAGCTSSGLKQCSGTGYKTCGNYDADTCLEWSATTTPCLSGQTCSNGVCGASNNLCTDIDGDSYGTGTNLAGCSGSTTIPDCDDTLATGANINPGATEICDGKDNNCDGKIDSLDNGYNLVLTDAEAGESCVNSDIVNEVWCSNNQLQNEVKSCKDFVGANNFCYQGACASCVDTDVPAVNFTIFGETYNLSRINNHAKDSCKDSRYLNESSCSGNNVVFQIKDCAQFGNAYSCQNGACYCKPNYVITVCNSDDTALFRDASSCELPDYTGDYDCNGDGLISGPSCAGMENENVGIDGLEFEADKNYTKTTKPGISLVQLAEDNGGGADFNWNFSVGAEPLNFCNIDVEVADSSDDFGYTIVKNVSAKNKTLWVERLNKTSGAVCIKDIPGEILISDFSDKCNGVGEVLVPCPGKNSTYNCEIIYDTAPSKASWFQVWPLNHSAVKEITFLASAGAGACSENWNCTNWTNLADECGTRICNDLNNCGTNFTRPDEEVSCISQGAGECVPDWDCADFGKCADGIKERVCADLNNCGDDSEKPSETQECKKISPLIIALAVVGLLLIIFLIWYFTRKKDEEEYSDETPAPHHSPPRSPPTNVYTPRPAYAPRP